MKKVFFLILTMFFFVCSGSAHENKITPVSDFNLDRYLGKWYEIARYDHSFERNLQEVTAEYSLRKDGKVKVLNSGYNDTKAKRKSSEGYAVFADKPNVGELKVTFFWPFFGTYRIAELDPNYQYAVVVGNNFDYLWILSRSPKMDKRALDGILTRLKQWGFDTAKINWIRQTK